VSSAESAWVFTSPGTLDTTPAAVTSCAFSRTATAEEIIALASP
jgi:hypothetical protein